MIWAGTAMGMERALVRMQERWRELGLEGARLARGAAVLYLAALGIVLTTAWHAPGDSTGVINTLPVWHLAFLMMTGASVAFLTLAGRDTDGAAHGEESPASPGRVSELMAQMSHELRTPLNAVIGFSEVMLRELHGPLGNVRYQEYAHHISESGGRLLKSSEQALAVTEAMTVLMADRRRGRQGRSAAANLLRDAWRDAGGSNGPCELVMIDCAACDILCERRPTVQALEHLFRDVLARIADGEAVQVCGKRSGSMRTLEVRVAKALAPVDVEMTAIDRRADAPQSPGLRIILARLLLEVQGATLACATRADGTWTATIAFPSKG